MKKLLSKLLLWLREERPVEETAIYSEIQLLLERAETAFSHNLNKYQTELGKLANDLGKASTNEMNELIDNLENAIAKYSAECSKIKEYTQKWKESHNRSDRQRNKVEPILEQLDASLQASDLAEEQISNITSLSETLSDSVKEWYYREDAEGNSPNNRMTEILKTLQDEQREVREISQIVGANALGNSYAVQSSKIHPRLRAIWVIGITLIYAVANTLLLLNADLDAAKDAWEISSRILLRAAGTSPILYLLIFAQQRYKEAIYLKEVYDHKKNTSLAFYSFATHPLANDQELKNSLIQALTEAVKIDPSAVLAPNRLSKKMSIGSKSQGSE